VARKRDLVIGFLSQEFTLDETKNVYENIVFAAKKELDLIREYEHTPFDSPKNIILKKQFYGWIRGILKNELICSPGL